MSPVHRSRAADVDPGDLDALEREVRRIRDALEETRCSVESPDGLIEATVGGRGRLVGLRLDPRIYRCQDAEALAQDILDTVRRATEQAEEQVARIAASLLPERPDGRRPDPEFDPFLHQVHRLKGGAA